MASLILIGAFILAVTLLRRLPPKAAKAVIIVTLLSIPVLLFMLLRYLNRVGIH